MPPNRLTEDDLQSLLEHVKVQIDPNFSKALQAELRARARELHLALETSEAPTFANASIRRSADRTQVAHHHKVSKRWATEWLKPFNMLSSVVLAAAALALVFLVLVRPRGGDKAAKLDLAPNGPAQSTESPTDVTPSLEALVALPAETPTPGIVSSPTLAPGATPTVTVTCSWTQVTGYVEQNASYVRLTVSLSSPTIQEIGSAVASVQPDGSYSVTVSYSDLPEGTHLIGGYGEWDGTSWLRPATMFGGDCQSGGAVATLTPVPATDLSPLAIQTVQFWPDTAILDRHSTVDFGARLKFESTLSTRARMLAFFIYQGEAIPDNSICLSQQIPGRGAETLWSTGTNTELAPGVRDFEQSYTFSDDAPGDATHLVMWLMLIEADTNRITCWQNVIELSPISP